MVIDSSWFILTSFILIMSEAILFIKSRTNLFLEPTSTEQLGFYLQLTTGIGFKYSSKASGNIKLAPSW